MKSILKITIIGLLTVTSLKALDITDLYGASKQKKEKVIEKKTEEIEDEIKKERFSVKKQILKTQEEREEREEREETEERDYKTKQEKLNENIRRENKIRLEELEKRKSLVYEKRKFNTGINQIFLKDDEYYKEIRIPFRQIVSVKFDTAIKEVEYIKTKKIEVKFDPKKPKLLMIKNYDPDINTTVKVLFVKNRKVNFNLTIGDKISKRFIEHEIYLEKKQDILIKEFQNKLAVKNVKMYFNNVAIKVILDLIEQREDFKVIEENKKVINKVLYIGDAKIKNLYGMEKKIRYKLNLDTVYETQYIENKQRGDRISKLVILELTITNLSKKEVLIITEEFMKKRFENYVAFYIGDLESKENYLNPEADKKIIIVIENEVEK